MLSPPGAMQPVREERRFMNLKNSVAVGRATAIVMAAAIVATVGYTLSANDDDRGDGRDDDGYTIALFGDMPYNALGKSQYPALLADFNRSQVAFSVHNGDLKSGGDGPCADSLYHTALGYFNSLDRP